MLPCLGSGSCPALLRLTPGAGSVRSLPLPPVQLVHAQYDLKASHESKRRILSTDTKFRARVSKELRASFAQGMSWAQRERVLQLLFARLSDAAAAAYFTELPKHSFAVEEEPPLRGVVSDAGPASLV